MPISYEQYQPVYNNNELEPIQNEYQIGQITPEKHGLDVFDSMLSLCTAKTREEIRGLYAIEPSQMTAEFSIAAHSVVNGYGGDSYRLVHEIEVASIDGPDTKWIFDAMTGQMLAVEYSEDNYIGEDDQERVMKLGENISKLKNKILRADIDEKLSLGTADYGYKWIGRPGSENILNSNQQNGNLR